jgi:hypothetical protein
MTLTMMGYRRAGALIIIMSFVSQHATCLGSVLAGDCEDLYAIAPKRIGDPESPSARSLGVGLEPVEDLSSAIMNRRGDPIRRLIKCRADMSVGLRHPLL